MQRRVGMIGTGWMGNAIAPDFAADPNLDRVAVAGRDPERTAAFAAERGIPRALTPYELATDPDLDLVYIATPHDSHLEHALAAIGAGHPVVIEKPVTVTTADAERLFAAAR